MTGDPDIKPKPWEPSVQLVSAVGTCDPELERRYSGGMAMTTHDANTDTSTWCTISLPRIEALRL